MDHPESTQKYASPQFCGRCLRRVFVNRAILVLHEFDRRRTAIGKSSVLIWYKSAISLQKIHHEISILSFQEHLAQIGFVRYLTYPCVPLLLKTLFTMTFWLTLRQSNYEASLDRHTSTLAHLAAPFQVTVSAATTDLGPKTETKKSKIMMRAGAAFKSGLLQLWIWIVILALFVCAVTGESMTVFRISYMGLFLTFMITFQVMFLFFFFKTMWLCLPSLKLFFLPAWLFSCPGVFGRKPCTLSGWLSLVSPCWHWSWSTHTNSMVLTSIGRNTLELIHNCKYSKMITLCRCCSLFLPTFDHFKYGYSNYSWIIISDKLTSDSKNMKRNRCSCVSSIPLLWSL